MLRHHTLFSSLLLSAMIAIGQGASLAQSPVKQKGKNMPAANPHAIIETSMGSFEIELYPADAPKTVQNFVKLAQKKFFDGMRFHRVVKGFVIQTGDNYSKDPSKADLWGTGGESIYPKTVTDPATNKKTTSYEFDDELNPKTASYQAGYMKGVVAMANRGPNTNTSQFFVMLADNTTLPKNYTIFGKVVRGMDVVDKIGLVELDPARAQLGRPKTDVIMKKVSIVSHPSAPAAKPGKP
jgi:cyclophilin family peptidyl-prolyl cis-trans isomerase